MGCSSAWAHAEGGSQAKYLQSGLVSRTATVLDCSALLVYAFHAQGWGNRLIQKLLSACKCACLSAVCPGSKYLARKQSLKRGACRRANDRSASMRIMIKGGVWKNTEVS